MQYLGYPYTNKLFVISLQFRFNSHPVFYLVTLVLRPARAERGVGPWREGVGALRGWPGGSGNVGQTVQEQATWRLATKEEQKGAELARDSHTLCAEVGGNQPGVRAVEINEGPNEKSTGY